MARTILITGAGGGIGKVLAQRLLIRGERVIASARAVEQLADLTAAGATPVAMDVGDDASVARGFESIAAIDAAIHCAAIAPLGTVEFTSPEAVGRVFNVNTLGALRVLQHSLPLLRASDHGRLVLLSSLWGQVSGPFVSSYAASKHAIEALADSARRETKRQKVSISVVEPGVVKTPMYFGQLGEIDSAVAKLSDEERRLYAVLYADHRKLVAGAARTAIDAERCAKVIEACLDARRPKPRYRAGTDAKAMVAMRRLLTDRGLDRVFATMYKG